MTIKDDSWVITNLFGYDDFTIEDRNTLSVTAKIIRMYNLVFELLTIVFSLDIKF